MYKQLLLSLYMLLGFHAIAQPTVTTPSGSIEFGHTITVLTNGNYVVTDPYWSNGIDAYVGAVYLYDGKTHSLISKLTGSVGYDRVGSGGVTALANGNYVVRSPYWNNEGIRQAGAVTWGSGTAGIAGVISSTNSLVGTSTNDQVGLGGIIPLVNGNYVVSSTVWDNGTIVDAGAVTWGNGVTGISGIISSTNSLVGSTNDDQIGRDYYNYIDVPLGITALTNGNYVVCSPYWDNGTIVNAGAVTWGNGTTGITGIITSNNSLVGSRQNDSVGGYWYDNKEFGGVIALTNGNYVVRCPFWDNEGMIDVGAVTWANGTTGITGIITSNNSLVGSRQSDLVGRGVVVALNNGNYVVSSYDWNSSAGAVTWGDGTKGISGIVSSENSLIGNVCDQIGNGIYFGNAGEDGIIALANGDYVVCSPNWSNGNYTMLGAVTWGDGKKGITGFINSTNSLIGTSVQDQIGIGGVTALQNGNYVISSPYWNNQDVKYAGAITWGNGKTGTVGLVSNSNSLIGGTNYDMVGFGRFDRDGKNAGVIALTNGNYVVRSYFWDNGNISNAGAVTWGNGSTGISGYITSNNSLVGSREDDRIGSNATLGISYDDCGIIALSNGNYVVRSTNWDNANITDAGAVTWGNGRTGTVGTISGINSLVGNSTNDWIGGAGVTPLSNGNYVVASSSWDDGAIAEAGAVTWGDGTKGISGVVSALNSIVGNEVTRFDGTNPIVALTNGNYLMFPTGKIITGSGINGIRGPVDPCMSTAGTAGVFFLAFNPIYNYPILGINNKVYLVSPENSSTLAASTTNSSISSSGSVTFIDNSCQIIASLTTTGATMGTTTAKVWIDSTLTSSFVKRHYEITPSSNSQTAKSKVTLYFTQAEFDDFNALATVHLPSSPDDAIGKANLLIEKRSGSSNDNSGLPNSYGGSIETIDPDDGDIVWNYGASRWEISFHVIGFSGFFVKTGSVPLPVRLISFSAREVNSEALLEWQTGFERNNSHFEITRSLDGVKFETIGQLRAKRISNTKQNYTYKDTQLSTFPDLVYYRLHSVDEDGSYSKSRTVSLMKENDITKLTLYPNPIETGASFRIDLLLRAEHVSALDIMGRNVEVTVTHPEKNTTQLQLGTLASGLYLIKINTGSIVYIQKLLVK
ncbi:T9SS type A sorting domain-containing protein [Siphonobacter sp. SORGH_AS_1065]|uniref:T9SS type A sorting domain-containing protein n=1 Tax=Siphonobacter sp. SORGH_AS_1065 TaxID=3041795 RepID=UPI0027804158|nr:T9SS type A sorting domain-containing protein [Siphonobacter sp. SORGH_AS_1065]MDQ1089785.1 hypothetical protein [Siphonobacter sp. SORGH_AS_1065]